MGTQPVRRGTDPDHTASSLRTARRSDAELVAAARSGDRTAYGTIIERHLSRVTAVIYAITGTASEELVHETFVQAWKTLPRMQHPERFSGWVAGIARNIGKRHRRERRQRRDG